MEESELVISGEEDSVFDDGDGVVGAGGFVVLVEPELFVELVEV